MATSFSSLNIQRGEVLTFVPTCRQVVVIDDSHIANTDGTKPTTLSGYCVMNMPEDMRNKSNSYQGTAFFTYNGEKISDLIKKQADTAQDEPQNKPTQTLPDTQMDNKPTQDETKPQTAQNKPETKPTQAAGNVAQLAQQLAAALIAQQPTQAAQIDEAQVAEIARKIIADELTKRDTYKPHNVEIIHADGTTQIENAPDNFENICNLVANRQNIYLVGPAGCGKSYTAKLVAKALKLDYYELSTVSQEYKATGYMDANGRFVETELTQAVKNGGLLFFDELDCSCQDALTALNGLLAECDKNGGLFHCADGKQYKIHENFRVLAAGNTVMAGATAQYCASLQQSAAGVNRWVFLPVTYSKNIELLHAEGDAALVAFAHDIRKAAKSQGVDLVFSYRDFQNIKIQQKASDFSLSFILSSVVFKQLATDTIKRLINACYNGGEWLEAAKDCKSIMDVCF